MKTITLTKCDDGVIWVTSDENQNGTESAFVKITDERQQMLIALADFLGYEPYELFGDAFMGCPGWEDPYAEEFEVIASEPKLKPCPFCGADEALFSKSKRSDGGLSYEVAVVGCENCGCQTDEFIINKYFGITATEQDAIDAWNRRA